MAALTVPQEYLGGITHIMSLSAQDVDAVVSALGNSSTGTEWELFSLLRPALPSLKAAELKELISALHSLYGARTGMDFTAEEFSSELVKAIRNREDTLGAIDESQTGELQQSLKRILDVHPLSMVAKGKDLLYEFENLFCDARVVTDIRPVFDADIHVPPREVVVTHTLKLEYHHSGVHTEIHIALDKNDIDSLIEVLVRAQEKSDTLLPILTKAGLTKICE